MPFSRENVRFTTTLIGIVLMAGFSVFGIVLIARTPNPQPTLYATVLGIPSMIVMQLLHMLRTEAVADSVEREVVRTRHDIKGEIQPVVSNVEAVAHGIERVSKQLNGGDSSPYLRRDEVESLVAEVAERVCAKIRDDDTRRAKG